MEIIITFLAFSKFFFFFFFPCVLLLSPSSSAAAAADDDAAALLSFKLSSVEFDPNNLLSSWSTAATNSNSSSAPSPCSWTGVSCSAGRVEALNLSNMGLVGRLRIDSLMPIPNLRILDLRGNSFYGNLSYYNNSSSSSSSNSSSSSSGSSMVSCSFETVDLSSNTFNGTLSAEFLSSCSNLASLNLSRNSISGGAGFAFGSSLKVLDVSRNQFSDPALLNYSLSSCRLNYLNFSGNKLSGRLPEAASSCSALAVLDLSGNLFSGELPAGFVASLPASLNRLDLSRNNFSGDFSGYGFGACANVTEIDLSYNGLGGGSGLPPSLANCRRLRALDLAGNNFSGEIPSFWGGFGELESLSLAGNQFSGPIPAELGRTCGSIAELDLSGNDLVGGLPPTFASCSSLRILDLGSNQLSGDFVERVVGTLPALRVLRIPFNNISGPNPLPALENCSSLQVLDLGSNELTGEIPASLCASLPALQRILLPNNNLSGAVPRELGNCTELRSIDLSFNYLTGPIPGEVGSLPKLADLVMWANGLSGEIPSSLCAGGGASLETLVVSYNAIGGSIPPALARCSKLVWVSLAGNRLTGGVPAGFGSLESLAILQLSRNSLSGYVPGELGNCKNLIWLDLNSNQFDGPIPASLASQAGLITPGIVSGKQFAFLRNEAGNICPGAGVLFEFSDIRPERLASFPLVHNCPSTRIYTGTTVYTFAGNGSMIYVDLSYNRLSGTIPETFGSMAYLQVLNLGHNQLSGAIPASFGGLKSIGALDLSYNRLSGSIPGGLGALTFLADFDVSNNDLTGEIPTSGQLTTFPASRYWNNSGLCGVPLPPCGPPGRSGPGPGGGPGYGARRRFVGWSILVGVALSLLIIFSLVAALYKLRTNHEKGGGGGGGGYVESLPSSSGTASWKLSGVLEPLSINVATFEKPLRKLTFAHLLEATNGFGAESLIGSGGFGEVYKARLKDGSAVAIKKLIHVTGQGDREFTAEMETIGKVKHRNLVPLLGYCKIGEERLLVYEYMKFGSLDVVLHEKPKPNGNGGGGGAKLDWAARKKIAVGAARGLAFLHHSCIPHIIHRDMKSSNVLLDENLEARVSDFGMARLMNALDTHLSVSTLAGTPGYVPPEYYQSFRCTTKGDVYSYGVVLLELLSGKKPIDPQEFGDNNLVGWAKQMIKEDRSDEIFDPELSAAAVSRSGEAELYQYLRIACQCLDDRPLRRPTMIQVMAMFKELQIDSDSDFLDGFSIARTVIDETGESAA